MLEHLRNNLLLLSVGCLLFACSTDEPAVSRQEMRFGIYTVSRATVTTGGTITRSPFALFGDRIPTPFAENTDSERAIVYHNTQVTYNNSVWTTPLTQYWYHLHEHSFVALHPASVLNSTDVNFKYNNNELSFIYSLPADYKQTNDILAATHRRQYIDRRELDKDGNVVEGTSSEAVYFRFEHIMSQINIAPAFEDNIMTDEEFIEFHKIVISGFKNKTTFNIKPGRLQNSTQTDEIIVGLSNIDGNGSLTIEYPTPVKVKNHGGNIDFFGTTDAIIMIPQSFADNSEAKIVLSYTINDDSSEKQITLPLRNQKWESGKSYRYKFTVGRYGLLINTTNITDWEVFDLGNIDAR